MSAISATRPMRGRAGMGGAQWRGTRRPRRGAAALAVVGLLSALVLAWAAAVALAWWADLGDGERQAVAAALRPRAGLLLLLGLALPLLLWVMVRPWLERWPRAALRLREEVAIATSAAHAAHRITPGGAPEMRALAQAIDALAQAHARLQGDLEQRIAKTKAALGEESQRLAALMSQLTFGVLVCNRGGQILLYNGRAVELLGPGAVAREGTAAAEAAMAVGLGRPVGALLDAHSIEHAWQQIDRRVAMGEAPGVASFVAAQRVLSGPSADAADKGGANDARGDGARLLHVQMVPTPDAGGALGGAVLLIDDVTRPVHEQGAREALLRQLTEGLRGTLANLRTSLQALEHYPAMAAERRQRLVAAAHEEVERLAHKLEEATRGGAARAGASWPMHTVPAAEVGHALQRLLRADHGIDCRVDALADSGHHLYVDSQGLVRLLAACGRRLAQELGGRELAFESEAGGLRLALSWVGPALPAGRLEAWEDESLEGAGATGAATLRDVLNRHGAELWAAVPAGAEPGDGRGAAGRRRLCLQLGALCRAAPAAPGGPRGPGGRKAGERPIAYDFDLFNQAGQNTELDLCPLAALQFTVFDAETTGLRPSEGDEIIALGAVRIVNGRLLEQERFDRRVRPRRAVRASAEAVHGISTAELADEPPLEQVLPAFARFCGDSVLVAHNAAFDMRFLELARERTGVRFDQPVLDTMLLSAAVQPGFDSHEHHLEQIARRLGVPVQGRHQALGDALTTGAVLLKLLPLLAARGIHTLSDARRASQQVAWAAQEKF